MHNNRPKYLFTSHRLLMVVWLVLFTLALVMLIRPKPEPPIPNGWTLWKEIGPIYTLIPFADGILAGGSRGIRYIDTVTSQLFAEINVPDQAVILTLAISNDRSIWVGHTAGLSILKDHKWSHYDMDDGIPRPPVYAIAFSDRCCWLGGYGGLIKIPGEPPWKQDSIARIAPSDRLPINKIRALLHDKNNGLWIGSNEPPSGGVFRLDEKGVLFWDVDAGLPHPQVTSFLQSSDGRVWAGTGFHNRGGAAIFVQKGQKWILANTLGKSDLAGPKVRSLSQDDKGYYWVGSENDGLAVRDRKSTICLLDNANGLPGNEVTDILQTKDGAIWLATLKGVARISPQALSSLRRKGVTS